MRVEIVLNNITVRELVEGYSDDGHDGVRGYGGRLDIRPPYQRAFIYGNRERDAVIDTITKNHPLNVMYWAVRDDGSYEIIDGQQRTVSIARYTESKFSFKKQYFHGLPTDRKNQILDYELMVYLCSGTDSERLEWFKTINIAGKELTNQELRNAVYSGPWVTDAKKRFSKNNCPAYLIGKDYLKGKLNRQEYLETAIRWISKGNIEDYMGRHQNDPSAVSLWNYFQSVINWLEAIFTEYRSEMKGVNWGTLYDSYLDAKLDPAKIEKEVEQLIMDDDVTSKAGIYPYILTREEKHLNIRTFTPAMRQKVYERQSGECLICNDKFKLNEMEADHITPWIEGGKTVEDNCQMLCRECNRRKSTK